MISNANLLSAAAVILAPRDKVEMEDALRTKLRNTGPTRIVCRTGDPLEIDDLAIVDLENCRAIVILTPDDELDPDAFVIKTLLAVENASLGRRVGGSPRRLDRPPGHRRGCGLSTFGSATLGTRRTLPEGSVFTASH